MQEVLAVAYILLPPVELVKRKRSRLHTLQSFCLPRIRHKQMQLLPKLPLHVHHCTPCHLEACDAYTQWQSLHNLWYWYLQVLA